MKVSSVIRVKMPTLFYPLKVHMILGTFSYIKHGNFLEFITWLEGGWFVLLRAITPFFLEANLFISLCDGEGYLFLVCFGFHLWMIRLGGILNFHMKNEVQK